MSVDELPRCPLKHRVSAGLRVNKTDPRIHCLDCGLSIAATDWVALYERWANRESHAELERERDALKEALTCDGNSVTVYTLLDWCADRLWLVVNGETDKLGDREGQEAVITMLRAKGKRARAALGETK